MGGVVFDQTGSYQLIFIISAIMSLVAVGCTLLIRERRHGISERQVETSVVLENQDEG